ncbi:hypothetical protein AYO21_02791 [Fonsecaea monophora]|uniref:N-acetyltransferase domain-containing protein n=1 Tax=Fonsecaea monophora TaxID=254056 RepID=A0A177FGV6_9EURO|nr:hypothetical protein AYO21_02791 [Fonsecaea monophora]OAG42840.1 hypothetical protein AYO21_02791 [Fonsecaea monophora]
MSISMSKSEPAPESVPLTPGIHLLTASTPNAAAILDGIVHIHASCILNDGTLATFLPPLSHAQIYRWWEERLREVGRGERHILVCLSSVRERTVTTTNTPSPPWDADGRAWPVISSPSKGSLGGTKITTTSTPENPTSTDPTNPELEPEPEPEPEPEQEHLDLSGVVTLATPFSQTGPFRALVEKLFVSPLHRRRGIATRLMARLERVAVAHGRWNLMLDTEVGSGAELVYPRLGYERLGVVREYGFSPRDGRLVDEVWFWKDLRAVKDKETKERETGLEKEEEKGSG